jgi:hypothetical protein
MPLKANYWCAFVLAAMRTLRENGSMAVVLPAAWDYARYARRVRDAVTAAFGEVTVVRSASPLFPGVLEGAVVVVAQKRGERPCVLRRVEVPEPKRPFKHLLRWAKARFLVLRRCSGRSGRIAERRFVLAACSMFVSGE